MEAGDAESAAILTPYNGQVRLIRRILKEHTGDIYQKVLQCCAHVMPRCNNSLSGHVQTLMRPETLCTCFSRQFLLPA